VFEYFFSGLDGRKAGQLQFFFQEHLEQA